MADNIQKTLDIRVNYSEALDGIAKYRIELDRAKQEAKAMTDTLKTYDKALKDGSMSETEYSKRVLEVQKSLAANKQEQKQYADAISSTEKVIKNQITQQNLADDSIKALRAQLSNLTKEYDELSASQRNNTEVGGKLLASINDVTDQIKEAEEATQRYQRNVGNYKSALEGMEKATDGAKNSILGFVSGGNPFVQMLINTSQQLGSVKQAFALAGQGAVMLGKQFLALMANPIVAFLAAIVAAFMALKNGIQSSEERMNKFRVIMAPLQRVIDTISNAIGKLCAHLLNLVQLASDGVMWLSKMAESLPGLGKYFEQSNKQTQEYIDIEKQRQAVEAARRAEITKTAEREREISNLRVKFAEKDKYTNEERLKFLDQAIAKEKEQAEANKRIKQMELDLLQREAALTDNDADMNRALEEAKAAVIRADTDLSNKMRELNAQRVEAINGINAEATAQRKATEEKNKAWREAQKKKEEEEKQADENHKQALATELELQREYEDTLIALIQDAHKQQRATVAMQYKREIEDLEKRLEEEENLTEDAEATIQALIVTKRMEMNQQIAELEKKQKQENILKDAEEIQRKAEVERWTLEARMAVLEEGCQELLDIQLTMLDKEYEEEVRHAERLCKNEEEKDALLIAIKKQYEKEKADIIKESSRKEIQTAAGTASALLNSFGDIIGGIDELAKNSKDYTRLSRTLALAQVAIDTGSAIATGVAQGVAKGWPQCIPIIASTIATILTNIATAYSYINQGSEGYAKGGTVEVERKHKYAGGGYVNGAGTGTSDSIHAMLSNGESVMTAAATSMYAPVLSAMNQSAGGNPISGFGSAQGEDMLARAVARGLMAMPNPVVSVEEINTTARRVQVLEDLASV